MSGNSKIAVGIFLINFALSANAQVSKFQDFKSNENICYCAASASTPGTIVGLDNNWELLLFLLYPKTCAQLDSSKVKYTSSQLQILQQWNLIKQHENGSYQTTIKLFDKIQSEKLRAYSLELSNKLTVQIKPAIQNVIAILKEKKRENNIYSILFSYILDDMVWDYLIKDSLIHKNEITLADPLWDGEFWTVYPKRDFYCGTNSISDKGYSIKVNWAEKAIPRMLPFVTRFDLQEKILNNFIEKGKVIDKEALSVFGKFNFFDSSGNFTSPVIIENDSNRIYTLSNDISMTVTRFLRSEINFEELKAEFRFNDRSQALIILYHEMLWDILGILEKQKLIKKPIAFADTDKASAANISDLIILIKK